MNLFDFEDVEPPVVREIRPVVRHYDGEEWIVGFIGPSNRDYNCIVCQRRRWPYEGGKQHYFRKYKGYSYNVRTIQTMKDADVDRVIIEEIDNERFLEFDLAQFENGIPTEEYDGEPELCVPVDSALHIWDADEVKILGRS